MRYEYTSLKPLKALFEEKGWTVEHLCDLLEKKGFYDSYTYFYDAFSTPERIKIFNNVTSSLLAGEQCPSREQDRILREFLKEYQIEVENPEHCSRDCCEYHICKKR